MPYFTLRRTITLSVVALAVATSAGLVLSGLPGVTPAAPAEPDTVALAERQAEQRDALLTSRGAERESLVDSADSLVSVAEQRTAALAETNTRIDVTQEAVQAQIAAEKAAAEKAAAEKAAAGKAAAEKAAEAAKRTPAQNKELGRQLAQDLYGWGGDQFSCYDNIIMRESLWDQHADNPTSSAYGIPQALPGKKMASEGADWETNPETQIRWGLKYVKERYGTPCKAWSFKRANGWY